MSPESDPDTTSAERLEAIWEMTNSWLRYAETKNGAIAAASLGLAAGIMRLGSWGGTVDQWSTLQYYGAFVLVELALGTCVALISFLPRTKLERLIPEGEKSDSDNLLYFGHIAKYSPKYLVASVRELEGLAAEGASPLEESLAQQIVINARIALWKFRCATWGVRTLLSALITPLGVGLVEYGFHREK